MHVCRSVYLIPMVPVSPQVDVYIFEPKGISMVETLNTLGEQFAQNIKVTSTKEKVRLENTQRNTKNVDSFLS